MAIAWMINQNIYGFFIVSVKIYIHTNRLTPRNAKISKVHFD